MSNHVVCYGDLGGVGVDYRKTNFLHLQGLMLWKTKRSAANDGCTGPVSISVLIFKECYIYNLFVMK
jgi:hypothetical protein